MRGRTGVGYTSSMANIRIVAFGHFDLTGGRSWAIRTGLTERGIDVVLCRTEAKGLIGKYRDLFHRWKTVGSVDAIYVPFLGHYLLPLAWILARQRGIPVVFDAFLSLYDTEVFDRKRIDRLHPKAWVLYAIDWLCCRMADLTLLDTPEHIGYFQKTFGADPRHMLALPIGCRTDLFVPLVQTTNDSRFRVEFHGTFIPLQGIDVILGAARILRDTAPDVTFTLIGKGQTEPAMRAIAERDRLTNVTFADSVPMEAIPRLIAEADVCLGIFGTTDKALRVIPNKAYEVLACGKALISGDTPAARRALRNGVDAILTPSGDPEALAAAILRLRDNPGLRAKLAKNARTLSLKSFVPSVIVEPLASEIRRRFHGA